MIKTDKIIILGGGSAGWMTAATLINQFPEKDITVIESPNVPTVGVGESTLGQINTWLDMLGIEDEDFMSFTDASYKLSIRFEDFYELGDGGFHYPFSTPVENNLTMGKQAWFVKKYLNPETPQSNYATWIYPNMSYVNNNTIDKNEHGEIPGFRFKYDTAYHFDAAKFGIWLRDKYCKPRGVKHIQEEIETHRILQDEDANIVSLNGYEADFFIDCTGWRSVLLGQSLNEPFISYSDLLPNNKAWATRVPYKDKEAQLEPYTNCTALGNGWVWNIPCWHRIGTGYVYSDKFISDEDALKEFKQYLDKKGHDYSESTFNNISMRVGIHKRIFVKNVCAIGLSAGFIEPLESNGLLSVHEFLINLVKVMKRSSKISQWDRDSFNVTCKKFFDGFTEFVAMHYALSHRTDTEYWRSVSEKSFYEQRLGEDSLVLNIAAKMEDENFYKTKGGAHCITTGMRYDAVDSFEIYKYRLDSEETKKEIQYRNSMVDRWDNIAKSKDSLFKYLQKNIHNEV
jgi:hypothetical protein